MSKQMPSSQKSVGSDDTSDMAASKALAKESSVALQYPMLTETNYGSWAVKMKVFMHAQGVWVAVESKELVDERKDQMALAAIFQAVPEAMMTVLAEHETSKEAWDTLKEMHVGADCVKEARAQTLMSEFDVMRMKETESIKDFAMKLATIVNEIRVLGDKMEERTVVKKFLRAVPDKFLPIVSTIEQFADMKTMTVMEVVGRLKVYEERTKGR